MLEFDNVSVKLGRKKLISDVSFSAGKGRLTAVLGKNGSGKSTLISCVSGLKRYSGSIRLSGRDISEIKNKERAKIIGFLPQIMPETSLSVRELVALGRNPYVKGMGILSEYDKKSVSDAMEMAECGSFAERKVNTLSGGEKRRVFIAMLLAQETPMLILDEPTVYLDHSASRSFCGFLRSLVDDHGKTILAVMHDLSQAAEIADDVAVLSGGKMLFYGEKNKALENNIFEESFDVKRFDALSGGEKQIFFL